MADLPITPKLRALLGGVIFINNGLHAVIPGKLPADDYQELASALKLMGGSWKKCKVKEFPDLEVPGVFVFENDTRPTYEATLSTGMVPDAKKRRQAFYTPACLVEEVLGAIFVSKGDKVLEPSAGGGAFAYALRDGYGADVTCYDIDRIEIGKLKAAGFDATCIDFLLVQPMPIYDFVVMNPPFTKGQDAIHVDWAFRFLRPGGTLLAIVSDAFPTKLLRLLGGVVGPGNVEVVPIHAGAFKSSGTNVATLQLVVRNSKGQVTQEDIEGYAHRHAVDLIHGEEGHEIHDRISTYTPEKLRKKARDLVVQSYSESNRRSLIDNGLGWMLAMPEEFVEKIADVAAGEVVDYFSENMTAV